MGQYFLLVNLDKKEYIAPHSLNSGAKFLEFIYYSDVLFLLLRKSNEEGGGDIDTNEYKNAGRWAGDKIILIGDYDESKLYDKALQEYKDISKELKKDINLLKKE